MFFEDWLIQGAGFGRVSGIDQLFIKLGNNISNTMMMSKVTDDLLMVGRKIELKAFVKFIGKRFPIRKSVMDDDIRFNGYSIQREGNVYVLMSMTEYMESILYLDITRERRKQAEERVTATVHTKGDHVCGWAAACPPGIFSGILPTATHSIPTRQAPHGSQ